MAELKFDIPTFEAVPNTVNHITFDGVTYDLNTGNVVSVAAADPQNLFDNFPFGEEFSIIQLYIPSPISALIGTSTYELTSNDLNDVVKDLVKNAYEFLTNELEEEFKDEPVAIMSSDFINNEISIIMVNWEEFELNENRLVKTLSWSTAEVGISTNFDDVNPTFGSPETPSEFRILMMGYGIDDCEWAGNRVYLHHTD
jgi:hypothetical protein